MPLSLASTLSAWHREREGISGCWFKIPPSQIPVVNLDKEPYFNVFRPPPPQSLKKIRKAAALFSGFQVLLKRRCLGTKDVPDSAAHSCHQNESGLALRGP